MGINYRDAAAGYRPSETYFGEVIAVRRHEVFLATNAHGRTRDGAWRSVEESLSNLQTDHVDLIQVHHLDHLDELDIILQPGGALAARTKARDQGLSRFIGVSSHDADTLLAALDAFDFDTVLVRVNLVDPLRGDFIGRVLSLAHQRNMGIIAMKAMDRRRLVTAGFDPALLLRYTLTQQVSTAIVGCAGLDDLQANTRAVRRFVPMNRGVPTAGAPVLCSGASVRCSRGTLAAAGPERALRRLRDSNRTLCLGLWDACPPVLRRA